MSDSIRVLVCLSPLMVGINVSHNSSKSSLSCDHALTFILIRIQTHSGDQQFMQKHEEDLHLCLTHQHLSFYILQLS